MVKIKVVKGSRLAVAAALILLVLVLAVLLARGGGDGSQAARSVGAGPARGLIRAAVEEPPPRLENPPRVLIYHTHTSEAYRQTEEDPYVETEPFRTLDADHSVVRVGRALAERLAWWGVGVVHDETDYEAGDIAQAYGRSLQGLTDREDTFDLCLDIHRDAYAEGTCLRALVNGVPMAPLFLLAGRGEGWDEKPDYEANYSFAVRLASLARQLAPGLIVEARSASGRYNQHLSTPSLLLEAGHNENTLSEAVRSMGPLADALASILIQETSK